MTGMVSARHVFRHLPRLDQAFLVESDQILSSGLDQRLFHKIVVVRIPVLDQGALHRLFMRVRRHIDRLHRPRIESRVVHTGRYRRRCRVEVLYLLRHVAEVSQVFRKLHCLFQRGTRVGGHEIRDKVLL